MSEENDKHEDGSDFAEAAGPGGAQLLHLADFGQARPARIMADLHHYWQGLRRGRAMPTRADVEPQGIGRALDHAFILDRVAPGAARFRLAGRQLIDLMGMEVRGMPICALVNPAFRGRFSDVLETVFRAPQIARFHLTAAADYARPALTARMLILPLRSDLGDVTRALGCLIAEGEPGATPRRFDIQQDEVLPLFEGGEVMAPSPSASAPLLQQGLAEKPARFKPAPAKRNPAPPEIPQTPDQRRALFRIVSDNGAA